MTQSPKKAVLLAGLFNRARCQFLLGAYEGLYQTAEQFETAFTTDDKLGKRAKDAYGKIYKILQLTCAIAQEDIEKITQLKEEIQPWNPSKATEGFVNYIKGISADKTEDKEEAIYRFKWVQENCTKTIFAKLAEENLALLK